ncbi:carbohydrate sulfotransferase 6-like [Pyxicephalus adspersus]|uniref:Sulfotransferase n=1 Tax=Pyxicephalus adspersus TaxID=30357 RepID=A0AAV3AAP2_PYXAD|nr:TPA: hypothetical protein GDO54_017187 [Pyxicephalus adspersus]
MSIRSIFFFFLLFFLGFFFYQFVYVSQNPHIPSSVQKQKKPVHILIISSWRSGSSFLGQIFNHHQDVFYLFEPGHSIWMRFRKEGATLLHYLVRDLIHSLFTCDVSSLQQYLPRGGKQISEMSFFSESRALCSPPSCSGYIPSGGFDRQKCFYRCKNATLDKMAEACTKYSHVVMKTVRIFDLSVLLPLFRDPALDLRILHLVRDPRAVASSRKYFSLSVDDRIVLKGFIGNNNIASTQVMEKICNAQLAINKLAMAAVPVLHDRYMLIRHEDLALEPVKNVKDIYEFVGLKMSDDMERWIHNITHGEDKEKRGFMTFSRQSSKVVQKWRTTMDFKNVKEIQHVCKDAMEHFGYLPVKSIKEQKNMTLDLIL